MAACELPRRLAGGATRMLKFTIRDLILLTALAAVAAGWWQGQRQLTTANRRLKESLTTTRDRLTRAEDLLEYQGILLNEDGTTYTTPEHARQLREQRAARLAAGAVPSPPR